MQQYFETLQDESGNSISLDGTGTVIVTEYPGGGAATIYSSNGTASPILASTVTADITGQVSFFAPDGAYILNYYLNGTLYKTKQPVQMGDPMSFVAATDSGAANAYVVNSTAYPLSLYVGLKLEFKATNTNTGASTMNLNSTGAVAINQPGGSAVAGGQIVANGLYRIEYDGTEWQIASAQSPPYYAPSAAEIAASITPVNTAYPWGAFRRYGMNPNNNNAVDNTPLLLNALACNAYVYDDYPGGGTYWFLSECHLPQYPFRISGQCRWPGSTSGGQPNGTKFVLGSAAGASASCLRMLNATYGAVIEGIGFTWQLFNTAQYGVRASNDLRYSIIRDCAFYGSGSAGTTVIGIQLDTTTVFSGGNVIRDSFFDALSTCIWLQNSCTTIKITNNEMYGHVGGANTGNAIEMDYPVSEPVLTGNYCEGFVNGVYANGATQVKQIGNDFQSCTNGFNWVQTTASFIDNQTIGETGVAGVQSGYSSLDASQSQYAGRLGWLSTGGAIQSTRGFQEGAGAGTNLRSFTMGYNNAVSFSSANFTGNGSMTWTVISAGQTTYSYTIIGKTMFVWFQISGTVAGTPNTSLQIAIPGGFTAAQGTTGQCSILNNGAWSVSACQVNSSGAVIQLFTTAQGNGNWTAGSVAVDGYLAFQIN